jgi:hypothetical protein
MRRSFPRSIGLGLVLLVVGFFLAARAQDFRPAIVPAYIDHARVIDVLRVINTAEYDYRRDHGSFAGWPELYASGAVKKVQEEVNQWTALPITAGAEVIPGYFLNLLVSRDERSYLVSLRESGTNDCGFSVFSDESGLIYQGTVIDCPRIGDPLEFQPPPRPR